MCVCISGVLFIVQTEAEELLSGGELMEKSLRSAIAESGATPSSGVTVDGKSLVQYLPILLPISVLTKLVL